LWKPRRGRNNLACGNAVGLDEKRQQSPERAKYLLKIKYSAHSGLGLKGMRITYGVAAG